MLTGAAFREEHVIGDQSHRGHAAAVHVVLRHISEDDAVELRRAFLALSPESRYRRFFGAATDLDDAALTYLTRVDQKNHVAIVAIAESLDLKSERGVGVARFVRLKNDRAVAEAAVTVVDDMQRMGLGALLTKTLARAALERGIERFRCDVLESNDVVVNALRDAGAKEVSREAGTLVLDVPLAADESVLRRALRVAAANVNAFLRRLLPPGHT